MAAPDRPDERADGSRKIDAPELGRSLENDGAACVFPDGDLENLSHFVQAYYHLPRL